MNGREIIPAVLAALSMVAAAQADRMPADAVWPPPPQVVPDPGRAGASAAGRLALLALDDLLARPRGMLRDAPLPIEDAAPTQRLDVWTDRQTSVGLCLCAFLSLGLCKSVPCVKRFALGSLPQWYHDGGPHQIGHSLAVAPEGMAHAPVCFVQPDFGADVLTPPYRREMILSLGRKARFTPTVDASRGPPSRS